MEGCGGAASSPPRASAAGIFASAVFSSVPDFSGRGRGRPPVLSRFDPEAERLAGLDSDAAFPRPCISFPTSLPAALRLCPRPGLRSPSLAEACARSSLEAFDAPARSASGTAAAPLSAPPLSLMPAPGSSGYAGRSGAGWPCGISCPIFPVDSDSFGPRLPRLLMRSRIHWRMKRM